MSQKHSYKQNNESNVSKAPILGQNEAVVWFGERIHRKKSSAARQHTESNLSTTESVRFLTPVIWRSEEFRPISGALLARLGLLSLMLDYLSEQVPVGNLASIKRSSRRQAANERMALAN